VGNSSLLICIYPSSETQVEMDRTLREVTPSNGGPWGSTQIDEAFEKLWGRIFGVDLLAAYKVP
jgi:hypothetical protein